MRHDALAPEIGEGDDRASGGHQREGGSCDGHERIGTDVERHRKPLSSSIHELSAQLFAGSERQGVDEKIDLTDFLLNLLHERRNLTIVAHVAGKCFRARQRGGELFYILFQPFVLIIEEELSSLAGR